jgi:hypothetical protein
LNIRHFQPPSSSGLGHFLFKKKTKIRSPLGGLLKHELFLRKVDYIINHYLNKKKMDIIQNTSVNEQKSKSIEIKKILIEQLRLRFIIEKVKKASNASGVAIDTRTKEFLEFESKQLESQLHQAQKLSDSTKTGSIILPVSKSLIKSKSLLLAGVVGAALTCSVKGLMYVADNYSRKEGDEPDYTEHWDWY